MPVLSSLIGSQSDHRGIEICKKYFKKALRKNSQSDHRGIEIRYRKNAIRFPEISQSDHRGIEIGKEPRPPVKAPALNRTIVELKWYNNLLSVGVDFSQSDHRGIEITVYFLIFLLMSISQSDHRGIEIQQYRYYARWYHLSIGPSWN